MPTRVAIFGDIHSNLQALDAAVERIEGEGVDMIVCAGDIVGYGANPNECCARVKRLAKHAVFGNHELSVLTGDTSWMNPIAAEASRWTDAHLSAESKEYLGTLELSQKFDTGGKRIAMYHGSVESAIEYVYEEDVSQDLLDRADADVLVLGHTHIPYVARFGDRVAVNPGSVGQPRDSDPRASLAILDTRHLECEQIRIAYDVKEAEKSIASASLPEFLGRRLRVGR